MAAGHLPEPGRERKGEQEVGHRQEQLLLSAQPLLASLILALGTVAVPAGVVAVLDFVTLRTVINMTAKGLCAAVLHGPHRLPMSGRQSLVILLPIRRSIAAEDSGQLYHDKSCISWSMAWAASSLLLWVRWV